MKYTGIRHYTPDELQKAQEREQRRAEKAAAKHAEGCIASKSSWPFCSYCGRDVRTGR